MNSTHQACEKSHKTTCVNDHPALNNQCLVWINSPYQPASDELPFSTSRGVTCAVLYIITYLEILLNFGLPSLAWIKPNPPMVISLATWLSRVITPAPDMGPQFIASPGKPRTFLRYSARASWKWLLAAYDVCPMFPKTEAMDENMTKKSKSMSRLI